MLDIRFICLFFRLDYVYVYIYNIVCVSITTLLQYHYEYITTGTIYYLLRAHF